MKKSIAISTVLIMAAVSANAAAGDAAAGQAKSMVCAACHGADGNATIPGYPNLGGQNEQYLVSALKAYRDGGRLPTGNAAVMVPQAKMLSDDDIANLAAYYSSM